MCQMHVSRCLAKEAKVKGKADARTASESAQAGGSLLNWLGDLLLKTMKLKGRGLRIVEPRDPNRHHDFFCC